MEKLCSYLSNRIDAEFAEAVGISRPYLSQIKRGLRRPSFDVITRIARATDNAVPLDAWAPPSSEGDAA